ncbi:MAG TPA: ribosome recycling factor [Candidatus Saccharimonadales bacterium]|nr:ribosome recycling factor [Candidatus Saccharimonadales bacterium]
MNPTQITDEAEKKFAQAVEHFKSELSKLRTGRAHPSMLDGVMVEAYGAAMPLNQVATIVAPESQLLQITPFDPNNLQAIAASIRNNPSLGMNPSDDGRVVRVPVPALTEERRRELVKQIGEKVEDCMVRMRTTRHDAFKAADQAKKDKLLSEDDVKRVEKRIDDTMNAERAQVDAAAKAKEQELMTV